MTLTEQIVEAIAIIESDNNPFVKLGDHGRALGRFQVHPDWLWQYAQSTARSPQLNETWDSFIAEIVTRFVLRYLNTGLSPVEVAMRFHLGHVSHPDRDNWDIVYADKFNEAMNEMKGVNT